MTTYHLYLREDDRTSLCGISMFYLKRERREHRRTTRHYPVHISEWGRAYTQHKCDMCMAHPKYPMVLLACLDAPSPFVAEITLDTDPSFHIDKVTLKVG